MFTSPYININLISHNQDIYHVLLDLSCICFSVHMSPYVLSILVIVLEYSYHIISHLFTTQFLPPSYWRFKCTSYKRKYYSATSYKRKYYSAWTINHHFPPTNKPNLFSYFILLQNMQPYPSFQYHIKEGIRQYTSCTLTPNKIKTNKLTNILMTLLLSPQKHVVTLIPLRGMIHSIGPMLNAYVNCFVKRYCYFFLNK